MLRITVFLLCFFLVVSQNVTPDDEDYTEGGRLDNVLIALEQASGLSSLVPNRTVSINKCAGYSRCTINPNGTLLWDLRADLYKSYLIQGTDDETKQKTTLDGCLKSNPTDIDGYRSCMQSVRLSMTFDLVATFNSNFGKAINADCSLIEENCVNAQD